MIFGWFLNRLFEMSKQMCRKPVHWEKTVLNVSAKYKPLCLGFSTPILLESHNSPSWSWFVHLESISQFRYWISYDHSLIQKVNDGLVTRYFRFSKYLVNRSALSMVSMVARLTRCRRTRPFQCLFTDYKVSFKRSDSNCLTSNLFFLFKHITCV